MLTSIAFMLLILGSTSQSWPSLIYGDWTGAPTTSPLGPFSQSQALNWNVRPLSNGGFIMWDNFTSTLITNSTQQFYSIGNTLYYCGWLENFFSTSVVVPIQISFQLISTTGNTIVWCESPSCTQFSWTMTVNETSLDLTILLSPPVVHLKNTFSRVSNNASVIPFDGTRPNCLRVPPLSKTSDCPYKVLEMQKKLTPNTPEYLLSYDNCYQLNDEIEYRIYWSLSLPDMISVAISIPATTEYDNWIAVGFGSNFPGMNTSDIVMGYVTPTGSQCVRSMTAVNYVGAPIDTDIVQLQNTAVTYSNGILSVQFERKLSDGHNPIPVDPPLVPGYSLIWAVGNNKLTSCSGSPAYHSHTRGYRVINVMHPEKVFDNYRLCK